MSNKEITCVVKPDRFSRHEHITHVGGSGGWLLTREEVIRQIESKISSFYVKDKINGKIAYVGVVKEAGKAPFIKTYADGYWNDNLLSLNECQISYGYR